MICSGYQVRQHIWDVGDVSQTCFGLLWRHCGTGLQTGNGFTEPTPYPKGMARILTKYWAVLMEDRTIRLIVKVQRFSAAVITLVNGTLKIMSGATLKLAVGIRAAIILAGGTMTLALSSAQAGDNLPPGDIIKRAQEKYASLTSYSDEGKTVATLNGTTITTSFTIRLARPNLYRIDWEQNSESSFSTATTKTRAVWSAGEGDFMEMGSGPQRQASQEMALGGATGISGGASATIPGTFFKMNWGNQLGGSALSDKHQADEKVGDVECYVLTKDLKGRARTLWIGKQDFLIHQVRTTTSAEAMKSVLAEVAKRNPEITTHPQKSEPQGSTSTETHGNIVLNQQFSNKDFFRRRPNSRNTK